MENMEIGIENIRKTKNDTLRSVDFEGNTW